MSKLLIPIFALVACGGGSRPEFSSGGEPPPDPVVVAGEVDGAGRAAGSVILTLEGPGSVVVVQVEARVGQTRFELHREIAEEAAASGLCDLTVATTADFRLWLVPAATAEIRDTSPDLEARLWRVR